MTFALSIRQPWAWAILHGGKRIENRTWNTQYRGELLIHAGLQYDWAGAYWIAKNMQHLQLPTACSIPRGGFVGKATLVDVIKESNDPWFFGTHGFVLDNVETLPFHPFRGQLKLFEVKNEPI